MGRCCCCCGGRRNQDEPEDEGRSGCCCCGRRGATVTFALLGLVFAAAVIAGPVYVYNFDQDYAKLFPVLHYGREYLQEVTGESINLAHGRESEQRAVAGKVKDETEVTEGKRGGGSGESGNTVSDDYEYGESELGQLIGAKPRRTPEQTYRLAIFQLLDDVENFSPYLAFFWFCVGCVNVPICFMLLLGALCRYPCALVPWLVITMIEHLVIGIPLIVFFGLISLYLAAQIGLYIVASALFGIVLISFFLSLSSWFTVYSTYSLFGRYSSYDYGNCDSQIAQPLLPSSSMNGGPPPLPPGHPGHYQQQQHYYPPHSQSRQLPSAPPHGPGIYPQLPMA